MTKPSNNNKNCDDQVEEVNPVQEYVSKFFLDLLNETGLTKHSFTKLGLQNYVKDIAKKCFQLQLYEELLMTVIKLASIFCKSVRDDPEAVVQEFVMILHKIVNFLAKYYLGIGLLVITGTMSAGMAAFVIFLFHVALFVIDRFSFACFLRIKDWILMLFKSENVTRFFEEIFPTYGKTLTMA